MKTLAVAVAAALLATPLLAQVARPGDRNLVSTNDPARLVALGERMERQGELLGATVFYERALVLDPAYPLALRAAANNAMKRGDGAEAMKHYSVWANAEPRNSTALIGLGSSLIAQQKPAEALAILDRAGDLGGPKGAIAAQRGIALDLQGNSRAAQLAYAAALDADPTDAVTTQRMALSLALGRDNGAALTLMKRFGAEPESADVRRTLALVHALGGRQEDAAEIAASLLPIDEAMKMRAFYARLPRLTPRERALAVHFGILPGNNVAVPTVATSGPPVRVAAPAASIPAPAPLAPLVVAQAAPVRAPPPASRPAPAAPKAVAPKPVVPKPVVPKLVASAAEIRVTPVAAPEYAGALPTVAPALTPSRLKAQPRFWVQVSSLSDPARLPAEWRRVRGSAGGILAGQFAYVQRAAGMNRLLIGPFASEWSARQMVGKLKAKRVVSIFPRTPAGVDLIPLG